MNSDQTRNIRNATFHIGDGSERDSYAQEQMVMWLVSPPDIPDDIDAEWGCEARTAPDLEIILTAEIGLDDMADAVVRH